MSRRKNPIDATQADTLAARFLRSAQLCRARDLEQLSILSDLVKGISELIHALQKERGASSIYLGSNGARFRRSARRARRRQSSASRLRVRDHLEHVDEKLEPMSCSARFYTRVAFAFRALDSLPDTREQVSALALAPQDAVKAFTDVIALLLAVGFEAADIAADPETSRALIALVNFAQGKEYAGQERATAGAALSRGHFDAADRRHLRHLAGRARASVQNLCRICRSPSRHHVPRVEQQSGNGGVQQDARARSRARPRQSGRRAVTADAWYEVATRRIDAMRGIESSVAADLGRLCAVKLAEAKAAAQRASTRSTGTSLRPTAPFAMLVTESIRGQRLGNEGRRGVLWHGRWAAEAHAFDPRRGRSSIASNRRHQLSARIGSRSRSLSAK